jgi:uncharacterized membrane protein (DUF2068 family)
VKHLSGEGSIRREKHPAGLVAIVLYKTFEAALLAVTAIALLLALKHHRDLQAFVDVNLVQSGKAGLIHWGLSRMLAVNPRTLQFGGIAAAVYAVVTALEAIGLWCNKAWAELLVIGLTALSIPPEILELIRGASLRKFIVFLLNAAALSYVLRRFWKSRVEDVRPQ